MAIKQRSPRVGDIITTSKELVKSFEAEYGTKDESPEMYFIVTALIDKAGYTEVYYKGLTDTSVYNYEFLSHFHCYWDIVEGATEKSIRLLYGF